MKLILGGNHSGVYFVDVVPSMLSTNIFKQISKHLKHQEVPLSIKQIFNFNVEASLIITLQSLTISGGVHLFQLHVIIISKFAQ